MQAIKIKPLSEMALTELFDAYGRIIWAQSQCEIAHSVQFKTHADAAEAVKAEVQRREDKQRFGAMFAQKPINREEDGDILFA